MRPPRAIIGLTLVAALGLSACGGGDNDEKLSSSNRTKASAAALKYVGGGAVTDAERGDGDDGYAYGVEVTLPGGTDIDVELDKAFAVTNSPAKASDLEPAAPSADATAAAPSPKATADDDRPLTGSTLKKASAAALKATDGGRITETSGSDDADHEYEVDVLLPSGEDVTVELDKAFAVTKIDR
ncbi:PepSY domain-containing protein [Aeromicrobium ginsengisoli]|uniref:PepSY domain-containing protein n=1 Tax=Aeromicrobium ginsengisoli TaxID=363867 RepID=A0A5M4FCH6_9ACTN|nr:PepSY domain-containing protein [Aeromicrobium ginsengisoli]KAA1395590.1 PepSY domain-containing protein [Aeromicrobium ginsengisoli]